MMRTKQAIRMAGAMLLLTWSAAAQQQTIKIWPGAAPGSEDWSQPEGVMKGSDTDRVVNIVTPTLTAYLPQKSKATGTGIIIAPGGGFSYLAIDKEGHRVASWLQERGIAGFVLKYRVRQMKPEDIAAFQARRAGGGTAGRGTPGQTPATGGRAGAPANAGVSAAGAGGAGRSMDTAGQYGIADGIQALKVLRQRGGEFGLSPDRIGIVGFSARGDGRLRRPAPERSVLKAGLCRSDLRRSVRSSSDDPAEPATRLPRLGSGRHHRWSR